MDCKQNELTSDGRYWGNTDWQPLSLPSSSAVVVMDVMNSQEEWPENITRAEYLRITTARR